MSQYQLQEVKTRKDKRAFLDLPVRLYRGDKNWVQPLDDQIEAIFDPAKNKLFTEGGGGEAIRWLLADSSTGEIVGRIAAFYNRAQSREESQPTGRCGFFECIDNQQAAAMLFDAARVWLAERGMEAMDGPVNFGGRMMWWGCLAEGNDFPLYGMPYNKLYYASLFESYGFCNYFNQYSYLRILDLNVMPEALYAKAERLYANPEYQFLEVDLSDIRKVADDFRTVYNSGWAEFTGVKPMTHEEALKEVKGLKPIIDPRVAYFAYHNGEPVGFFINIPNINEIFQKLHGRFGLWQKVRFLWALKRHKCRNLYGVVFGVASSHQGRGIEAAMINKFETFVANNPEAYGYLELAWVGDFNPLMIRMVESYVRAVKWKTHVTFRYLFDRTRPFERAPRLGRAARNA